jgi:nitrate reductase cytochrome c-type subunit
MVVLVISGLQTLSFVNKPPAMPKDIHHTTAGRNASAQCLRCHQREALERMNRHPAKWSDGRSDCLLCHIPAGDANRNVERGVLANPRAILERRKHP